MEEIEQLTSQEYSVLSLFLGLNIKGLSLTKSELAKLYGLSVARINTVISKGYQKLATENFRKLLITEENSDE